MRPMMMPNNDDGLTVHAIDSKPPSSLCGREWAYGLIVEDFKHPKLEGRYEIFTLCTECQELIKEQEKGIKQ